VGQKVGKKEDDKKALVSSKLIAKFSEKAKVDATKCVKASETRSEVDDCQPPILEDENEISELYRHQNWLDNTAQTCVTPIPGVGRVRPLGIYGRWAF